MFLVILQQLESLYENKISYQPQTVYGHPAAACISCIWHLWWVPSLFSLTDCGNRPIHERFHRIQPLIRPLLHRHVVFWLQPSQGIFHRLCQISGTLLRYTVRERVRHAKINTIPKYLTITITWKVYVISDIISCMKCNQDANKIYL